MTRKRKISYSELLTPAAPPVVPASDAAAAGSPESVPPESVPPAASAPDKSQAGPSRVAPTPEPDAGAPDAPRRRRADRARSPRDLAEALNERLAHERGASPPPVPAAGPLVVAPAPAAGEEAADTRDAEARPPWTAEQEADAMELLASSAIAAIPFKERARARVGSVELLLFRVGHELFAAPLASVDEVVELPAIRHLPEMADDMLGMFALRGRMIPIYSPSRSLGVSLGATPTAALVVRAGAHRVALAVDDVDDVLDLDLGTLRDAPGVEDADGILLGVARRGRDLVAVLDGDALVVACLTDRPLETS